MASSVSELKLRSARHLRPLRDLDALAPKVYRYARERKESAMNEDRFNMDIRKFLKVVGVTSQRQIEIAVRDALGKGKLNDATLLKPRITLSVPELGLEHVVDGEIGLS
jgi:hypothetical protein